MSIRETFVGRMTGSPNSKAVTFVPARIETAKTQAAGKVCVKLTHHDWACVSMAEKWARVSGP